ncbi:MAG: hypothetical protein ACFB50_10820, partial [Rubrobacteraceae bacterium]
GGKHLSNPSRGEIAFDYDGKHMVLKFSNAGRRAMEDFLDLERSEIDDRLDAGKFGERLMTGLFWGATRKFHRMDFPTIDQVDDLMDDLDDDPEGAQECLISLIAAYTREPKDVVRKRVEGEPEPGNLEAPKDEESEAQEEEAPPVAPQKSRKKSSGGSSETGTSSSDAA